MPRSVVRSSDLCTGHGCSPPRTSMSSSGKFFADGLPAVRVGDTWAVHGCKTNPPHIGTQSTGASKVFADGRPVALVGCAINCGSFNAQGSTSVFAD